VFAVIAAIGVISGGGQAFASPGCTSFNGVTDFFSPDIVGTGFNQGDIITATWDPGSHDVSISLDDATLGVNLTTTFVSPSTLTYTVPAATTDTFRTAFGSALIGTGSATVTCTPGSPLTSTTTSITSSLNPSGVGQSVTFTATTTGSSPTGTVTFKDGANTLGTGTLNGSAVATFTTSSLTPGSHSITASYGGDSNNSASTSAALVQVVNIIPADSIKLRQMQILATQHGAQISGQAIAGAIDTAIEDAFCNNSLNNNSPCNNPQSFKPNGSGFTFNFAADEPYDPRATTGADGVKHFIAAPDRKANQLIDDEFSALAYAGNVTKAPPKPTTLQRDWLGWIDVRGVSVSNNTVGADLKGNQVNVTAGLTRRLTPDFVIGVLGGYEHLDYTSDALNSRLKGDGWTVGSYLGWRLAQSLRFDMALARTGVDYNDTAGTAAATFSGSRWLASGGLTGTYHLQTWVLQPSARVYALWEHDSAYTDSLGTMQADNNFSTGRASAGTKLSYPFAWTPTIALAPYAGVYGDYYFSSTTAAVAGVSTPAALLQGWSARFTSGFTAKFKDGGTISAGGELGGIGSNTNTAVYTYRVQGSVPF